MSMGDLKNNLQIMRKYLNRMAIFETNLQLKARDLQQPSLRANNPEIFLKLTNFLVVSYSDNFYVRVLEMCPDIKVTNDKKFIEYSYSCIRKLLGLNPVITIEQFLAFKFFELKVQFVAQLAKALFEWEANQKNKKVPITLKQKSFVQEEQQQERPRQLNFVPAATKLISQQRQIRAIDHIPKKQENLLTSYIKIDSRSKEHKQVQISKILDEQDQEHDQGQQLLATLALTVNQMSIRMKQLENQFNAFMRNTEARLQILEEKQKMKKKNKQEDY